MKKIVYLFIMMMIVLSTACGNEEPVGQTPISDAVPPSVMEPVVENTPGGAKIYYTLPKEVTDISYVRAEYVYRGGLSSNKSSVYKNYVSIEGFATTDPVEVKLYTVSHSEVASQPLVVTIHPLTPPVFLIAKSFEYVPDFGGFRLKWDNPIGDEVVITLLVYDEEFGNYVEDDAVYSAAKDGECTFRGFESEPCKFGLYVRDKYFNRSDTVKFTLTPIYETKIKTDKFAEVMNIPGDDTSALNGWNFERMWNGVIGGEGWHSSGGNKNRLPLYFTWDLGMEVQLSRFTLWHRQDTPYGNNNIKVFELWGCTDYVKSTDINYYYKGGAWETDGHWECLGVFEIKKPSGDDSNVTSEDKEAMRKGFEFTLPPGKKVVRYLRFGMISNFSGGMDTHTSEIQYWGDDTIQQ